MNVIFEIGDHKFEWDSEKAEINLKKHKVAFEEASRIFLDEYRIDDYDELHSDDEERVKTIGFVRNVLAVIYTERGDRNRIISARRANKRVPPLTREQIRRLYELSKMTDDEIDYSDIPPLTDEELARMKPARLRKKNLKVAS